MNKIYDFDDIMLVSLGIMMLIALFLIFSLWAYMAFETFKSIEEKPKFLEPKAQLRDGINKKSALWVMCEWA